MSIKAKHEKRSHRNYMKFTYQSKDLARHQMIGLTPVFKPGKKLTSLEERGFTFEECEAMKAGFKTCEGCNRENAGEMIRR